MSAAVPPARILVVDDNEMNRDMLARRLVRQGHAVDTAENGRQALDRGRAGKYDLLLLDVMMPELDGRQVLAEWMGDPVLRNTPVVMISAADETEIVARCIELGADDYLPKPFNPVVLQARVGASLEKKRLRDRERLHAESLERELEIGRRIQATFLPETLPESPGWEIAALFEPARQCAGDFYDAFALGGGRIAVAVADVCDKGVGAALFMALFRSLLRSIAEGAAGEGDAAAIVRRAVVGTNDYIARTHGRANMFATLFFAVVDVATGDLWFVNGGHESPLLLDDSGRVVAELAPTGPAVGMLPDSPFSVGAAEIGPGRTLFAYTDGVTDAKGADGFFGRERLLALLGSGAPSAPALLERVGTAVRAHVGESERFDDLTVLAVRRGP